jgi:hypothetical protein
LLRLRETKRLLQGWRRAVAAPAAQSLGQH